MKIIDTHCDVLYKMQMALRQEKRQLQFKSAVELEANLDRLKKGGIFIQFFAIFVSPKVSMDEKWDWALEQINLFKTEIVSKHPEIKHIKQWSDLEKIKAGEIGAVLSLEGAEPIGKDINKLRHLYNEGVLSIGLTWNQANFCADGVNEEVNGGLTSFGKEVIHFNNEHHILTDVSHLSERSFWDVIDVAEYVFASHSNSRKICNHPRNLFDLQISALLEKNGLIHVTFYPPFINEQYVEEETSMDHLMKHIDQIVSLGGAKHLGFGSDFDGIDLYMEKLCNASYYPEFINELLQRFTNEEVADFSYRNFLRFIHRVRED